MHKSLVYSNRDLPLHQASSCFAAECQSDMYWQEHALLYPAIQKPFELLVSKCANLIKYSFMEAKLGKKDEVPSC
jgi:hypothetical protein